MTDGAGLHEVVREHICEVFTTSVRLQSFGIDVFLGVYPGFIYFVHVEYFAFMGQQL